jgi:hypothetical protein
MTPRRKDFILPAIVFALFIMTMVKTYGHTAVSGWTYPLECCSNQDCKQIPANLVWESQEGFEIAPMLGGGFVARGKERPSPDGEYHLCRSQYTGAILCLFIPPRGV